MTADNKFAARLRELSRLASAGPWSRSEGDVRGSSVLAASGTRTVTICRNVVAGLSSSANAALIVTLRNHADRLADLVERVEAFRDMVKRDYLMVPRAEWGAMLAALDALVADAPGAASGTESPPRMNGDAP